VKKGIRSFKDLIIWQKGIDLYEMVFNVSKDIADWGQRDQIRNAALSVSSNIAEGHDRKSTKEFIRFLYIARGSNSEVRTQLYAFHRVGQIKEKEVQEIESLCDEISRMIITLISKLSSKLET
jgi:four helix bundle protein